MKKESLFIIVIATMLAIRLLADLPLNYSMTNILAWVDVDINVSNVSNMPYRAATTPGDTFLGMIRAFFCKDCETSLFHSSTKLRRILVGTDDITQIPESYRSMFANSANCTNMVIQYALPIWTNACELRVKTILQEATPEDGENATMFLSLLYTNQLWKVDGISPDDSGEN